MTSWNLFQGKYLSNYHNMRDDILWSIFPYFYPYSANNSEKGKYSFFVPQFFALIPQTPVKGHKLSFMQSFAPLGRSVQMVLLFLIHFFFAWHAHNPSSLKNKGWFCHSVCLDHDMPQYFPIVMTTPICWRTLQTVGSRSLSPPSQHIHAANTGRFSNTASQLMRFCFDRILLTFLTIETSDSSFWKVSFKCLISAFSEAIVVLACSLSFNE